MIKSFLIVGLGGAAGSILSYGIQKIFTTHSEGEFPSGTLLVNISGCFLIGMLWSLIGRSSFGNEDLKLLLMTGFCGGFTTFSAFTMEGIGLLRENKTSFFVIYVAASVIGGLLATFIGFRIFK